MRQKRRPNLPASESAAKWKSLGPLAVLVALMLAFFGRAIFTAENFSFRDTAHYYYPQFAWEMQQWRAGEWPLWNRQENLGTSVAADPTACLFYPGKLLFALPFSFDARFKLFVLSHVAGAAVAAYAMARKWGHSRAAATLCGLSYAFGGNVLFLYTNVVYLIGAAWLPLAFLSLESLIAHPHWRSSLKLAVPLALIMLGGDFQLAYHFVLLGVVRAFWRKRRDGEHDAPRGADSESSGTRATTLESSPPSPALLPNSTQAAASPTNWSPSRWRIVAALAAASLAATLLAAAQVVPMLQASRDSTRAVHDQPRSVWELAAASSADAADANSPSQLAPVAGLFASPPSGTHHEQIYWFSVGPWRWVEFLWPNALGRLFPHHQRWGFEIPDEDRVWSPSLYQGVGPLILAFIAVATMFRRRERALATIGLGALLASTGAYGLGWLLRTLGGVFGWAAPQAIGDPTGGVYWLLVTLLPGYAQFRYPAKWGVIAALAIAALAASGFDRLFPQKSTSNSTAPPSPGAWRWLRRFSAGVTIASGVGLVLAGLARATGTWHAWLADHPTDDWLGPFDVDAAWFDTAGGLTTTFLFAALAWWFAARCAANGAVDRWRPLYSFAAVALAACDLAWAHRWMVETAPPDRWTAGEQIGATLGDAPFVRLFPRDTLPAHWSREGATDRIAETLRWDAATLNSKLHLLTPATSLDSPVATESYAYKLLRDSLATSIRSAASSPNVTDRDAAKPFPELATWLGIEHGLALRTPSPLGARFDPRDAESPVAQVVRQPSRRESNLALGTPRAWFAAAVVAEPDDLRFDQLRSATDWQRAWRRYLLQRSSPQAASTDPTTVAWRECPDQYLATPRRPELPPALGLLEASNGRLALAAQTPEPRLLVLAERFDPDWQVRVLRADGEESIEAVAGRVNWLCHGVWLPPGKWRVELEYRPLASYLGLATSLAAWAAFVGIFVTVGRACDSPHANSTAA